MIRISTRTGLRLFFRTGSIIFGGGQVVLPLLLDDVVTYDSSQPNNIAANSWVTEDQFFAGLASGKRPRTNV